MRNCDIGLAKADKLLLINSEDKVFAERKYNRNSNDIFIFKNGVSSLNGLVNTMRVDQFIILFNGTWIERKGIHVLISAAENLYINGIRDISYLLSSIMKSDKVLNDWPKHLQQYVTVIDKFEQVDEINYLTAANLFVLPGFSEGQPLVCCRQWLLAGAV